MTTIMNIPTEEMEGFVLHGKSNYRGEIGPFASVDEAIADSKLGVNCEYQFLTDGRYWYYRQYDERNFVFTHRDASSGNWKNQLAVFQLISKAKEMGISWTSIPDVYKDSVGESFMGYYQPGDSGDDEDTTPTDFKPKEKGWWYASKTRTDHHVNIRKDKSKHGKSSCKHRDLYGNYSKRGQKHHTSKRLRKEFFIPSGKSGYKKMQDVDYIF